MLTQYTPNHLLGTGTHFKCIKLFIKNMLTGIEKQISKQTNKQKKKQKKNQNYIS